MNAITLSRRNLPLTVSRRNLLKGGALMVGFSLAGLPAFADTNPADPATIDAWVVIHPDNTATLLLGKCELGQGNSTTMLQIAAEELDLGFDQVRMAQLDTFVTPNQGATVSSSSIARGAPQIRRAAAEARQALLRMAAQKFGADPASLTIRRGTIASGGSTVTYGELIGGRRFDITFTGKAPLKPVSSYSLVGTAVPRTDIPGKAAGNYEFMQHARLPNMLHGRVVRPKGQGAYADIPQVVSIDAASIKGIPGARVIRRGDFVGVVAPREWDAVRAAKALAVQWDRPANLATNATIWDRYRAAPSTEKIIANTGDTATAFAQTVHVASGTFRGPYQAHASFGPSCALADIRPDGAVVICSSQDIYTLRDEIAAMLKMAPDRTRVQYLPSAGCYGHNCFDDAAEAAAIMSHEAGQPVRVQFMRWDEIGWDNYGPAHLADIRAAADASGRLTAYEYHGWQHGWITTETSEQMATGAKVSELPVSTGVGSLVVNPANAGAMYDIPNKRLVNHQIDGAAGYMKTANLRSPLDIAISFASEQTMDALAHAAGLDPVAFRRLNITDARWRGVLDAVAHAANWPAAPEKSGGGIMRGRGVALGTHRETRGAAIAEIEVNRRTGAVIARHMYGAIDCGQTINPDIVESQVMGMLVQAASRMLKEEVRFNATAVTSLDWVSYPVLRFAEHPNVTVTVIQHMDLPSSGSGEEVLAAGAAAIANAFFNATGVRMTSFPLTPARVLAALKT